uniref:NPL4 homolog, ubiquitin recognition factor n=1 Tax=Astyanax mexicanus TaxID=7994 RepID=A0A8B9JHT7_ASTMX
LKHSIKSIYFGFSPEGMKKISSTKRETAAAFLKKVAKEFGFNSNGFSVYLNRNKTGEIISQNKTLSLLKIKHGDMLFLFPSSAGPSSETMDTQPHSSTSSSSSSSSSLSRSHSSPQIPEDEIDQYLSKQEGKIYRNRDPQLCRHGPMGKCVHCVPLEPFDEDYLNHLDPPVKHMSFHAYIRKLTGGADKGKFVALENISCKIKSGCEGHLPWPEGICTKCQPSAITLNRQVHKIWQSKLTVNKQKHFIHSYKQESSRERNLCRLASSTHLTLKEYKFGNDITYLARPLPVEYLIIDITTTFPKDPVFTFSSTLRFPIENRDALGETQDFHSLATYLSQCPSSSSSFLNIVSDFHLLIFLVTNEVMPLRDSIGLLLDAVKTSNEELAQTWKKSEQWATIEQLCSTVGGQQAGSLDYAMGGASVPASSSAMWSCLHCTFMNQPGTEHCEMCSLPRS